jgi:LacI family transcriptional regulator
VPTIYDVAKRASVSTYTVSCVLNKSAYVSPELTERVLKAVRELDYTPNAVARSLQTRTTKTIGMLIPDIANPFYARVVRGVEDRLRRDDYALLLGNTYNRRDEQARYLSLFRSRQIDALLVFMAADSEDDLARLVSQNRPVVCVGRVPQSFEADSVSANNIHGTFLAVDHLARKGHKIIGMVAGAANQSPSQDRIEGWRKALRKNKIKASESLIEAGDWSEVSGCEAALRLLDRSPRPTAIFVSNFLMMLGALRALKDCGIAVPKEVEIASSDDSEWLDLFSPPITTVVQPSYTMGERAADLALARLEDRKRPFTKVVLEPSLRPRD